MIIPRLKEQYEKKITLDLQKKFSMKNKFMVPKVTKIVTLTDTEYAALTPKDANTLYIAIADATKCTAQTMTLATTNNITGGTAGVEYTLSGDTNGATAIGCEGEEYSFTTIATPAAGYYFSTPVTGLTVTGDITNPGASVAQTLAGVIAANPTPTITATLQIVYDIQGGPNPTVTGNDTGDTQTAAPGSTSLLVNGFSTSAATPPGGYAWKAGSPTVVQASGTIYGSQTVVTTVSGTLELQP